MHLRKCHTKLFSQYVLTTHFRKGSEQQILRRFKVLDLVAHSGSLYYIQEVCTQFEPARNNVV